MNAPVSGRPNQKLRTRKALLQAAASLLKQGRQPTLEEVAEEALVSRATAYRYFPNVESLLVEASLDVAMPEPEGLFGSGAPADTLQRLERLDGAMDEAMRAHEASLRMMLAHSLQRKGADLPGRQNRRSPLIDAALEPERGRLSPARLEMLERALALVIGTEAMVVLKDVLQLSDSEARKVRRWAIEALLKKARDT